MSILSGFPNIGKSTPEKKERKKKVRKRKRTQGENETKARGAPTMSLVG
jgi:hypothetical protein